MKTTTRGTLFLAIGTLAGSMHAGPDHAMSGAITDSEPPDLAEFFGFEGLEVVRIDRGVGPVIAADINGDGLLDIVAVNNFKSRIEIHQQRPDATPEDAFERASAAHRVNDLPEHWRYQREVHSVIHRVTAIVAHDYDKDGLTDLIFASSSPAEIVFMRQVDSGEFQVDRRHRVRNLNAGRKGFALKDITGDGRPELVGLVRGEIQIWSMDGASITPLTKLAADEPIGWFRVEDFNGDGRPDIAGAIPDHSAPVRLWLGIGRHDGDAHQREANRLGPELRFEMPGLREMSAVRLPGEKAARIAVLERASKRLVLSELDTETLPQLGDRDAAMRIYSFTDSGNRRRPVTVVDINDDGMLDVVAADASANAIAVFRQSADQGLQPPRSYPGLSEVQHIVAIADADRPGASGQQRGALLFVLSEEEGVVGRSRVDDNGVTFPTPLSVPDGYTPVAMNLVWLRSDEAATTAPQPHLAVIARESRNYMVVVMTLDGHEQHRVDLGSQSRAPQTVVAVDADQDGRSDLLLFTPDRPMTMLRATDEGFDLLESRDMGQFGLVQAARAENTAVADIDGNGFEELLIADRNYVRAVRYVAPPDDAAPDGDGSEPDGGSLIPGWHVVTQINASDESARLASMTTFNGTDNGERIVAADTENRRLVIFATVSDSARNDTVPATGSATADIEPDSADAQQWQQVEAVQLTGFEPVEIHAGAFSGDGRQNILAVSEAAFAVIQFGGDRHVLREFASWVGDNERMFPHELFSGDVNSDGFVDLVMLEAGEQLCHIFTLSEQHELHAALNFKVFESKIFTSGEPREFEPRYGFIADVTGSGADDLVLICHDRLLIYPQMTDDDR